MKTEELFSVFKDKQGQFYRENDKDSTRQEVKLQVTKPNYKQQSEGEFEYAKQMNRYLDQGIKPSVVLERTIRDNGIWNDEKAAQETKLLKQMRDTEIKLKKGKMKVSDGIAIAKEGLKARGQWMSLVMEKNNILNNSADSLANNHRFNYLTAVCTVNKESGEQVFKNYEDFLRQDSNGSLLPTVAGQAFAKLMYNMDEDFRKDWYEYVFLLKYKAVNEKLEFVDKDGNVVDIDGNPVVLQKEEDVEQGEFYPDEVDTDDDKTV